MKFPKKISTPLLLYSIPLLLYSEKTIYKNLSPKNDIS